MLRVNFSAYRTYVTDSLYQWDKNQKIAISGMGLTVAPEIRFTNEILGKSIVRQSRLEDGVIIANVPNSLLQHRYKIRAYIGVYEGDAFNTIEIIDIPVIAQARPLDYVLTDGDEEVYSFNALEHKIDDTLKVVLERYDEVNAKYAITDYKYNSAVEEYHATIGALDGAVATASEHKTSAQNSASQAQSYATQSQNSASQAQSSANSAENAKNNVVGILDKLTSEDWTFVLENGTSVTKKVCLR